MVYASHQGILKYTLCVSSYIVCVVCVHISSRYNTYHSYSELAQDLYLKLLEMCLY